MKRPTMDWRILGSEGEIYYLVCWDGFEAVVQERDGDIDSYPRLPEALTQPVHGSKKHYIYHSFV